MGYVSSSGVEEGGAGEPEPPSCDLKGAQPPNSAIFLEIRAYKNHYSVVKGYFRLESCRETIISQDIGY